jgi:hypothetical protein
MVGLDERDFSVVPITADLIATLVAYDASGAAVGSDTAVLGRGNPIGPVPINVPLEVARSSDVIHRVELHYSSNAQEVIDDLEFEVVR